MAKSVAVSVRLPADVVRDLDKLCLAVAAVDAPAPKRGAMARRRLARAVQEALARRLGHPEALT